VLHFDLRIAGFADLESLYKSLSTQMESYFDEIAKHGGWYEEGLAEPVTLSSADIKAEGWDTFEADALAFKHDRIAIEKRIAEDGGKAEVRPSDIARLMELFQSSLLRYREFQPGVSAGRKGKQRQASEDTMVEGAHGGTKSRRWFGSRRERFISPEPIPEDSARNDNQDKGNRQKRVPVSTFL